MATMLERQLTPTVIAAQPVTSSAPEDQASFSAAPTEYAEIQTSATGIVITIGVFYAIIYLLHVMDRGRSA